MKKILFVSVVFTLMVLLTSCQKAEEVTVSKYFQAMGHNDRDTMSAMAAEPRDLEYVSYDFVSVSEPIIEEYRLPEMIQKQNEMKKQRRDLAIRAGEKRDEMEDLKDELEETRRRSTRAQLRKDIEEAEVEFYKAEQEYKNLVKEMGELKKQIEREKMLVNLSTGLKDNPEIYQGKVQKNHVRVNVEVEEGETKEYVFTLVKYIFTVNEKTWPSRFIILKIQTADDFQVDTAVADVDPEMAEPEPMEEISEDAVEEDTDAQ